MNCFMPTPTNMSVKFIFVKKGFRPACEYHKQKDEKAVSPPGEGQFSVQPQNGKMRKPWKAPGYVLHLPPMDLHRVEAWKIRRLEVSHP